MSPDAGDAASADEQGPDRGDGLDAVVSSVSDGHPVDWTSTTSGLSEEDQARLAALEDISRIATFNRSLQREDGIDAPAPVVAAPTATPDEEATRWGDLILLEPLGRGTGGHVWRAWDLRLRRDVALKFLHGPPGRGRHPPAGAAGDDAPTPDDSAILTEARALARLNHPNVVEVYGVATHEGRAGMWMELLHGETLAGAIERSGRLRQSEIARIGRELALALQAVHDAGLVHRDMKPANVVLEPGGRVVLTDFGLGRERRAAPEDAPARISGTPMFMAPELHAGEPASPRSDIYALGVALRWALTGRPPFAAQTMAELQDEIARGPSCALRTERPNISPVLARAIERAMAAEPRSRFENARDLARALAGDVPGTPHGAAVPPAVTSYRLPAERDAFVGREEDLEELEGKLEIGARLVTFLGPGGMGKTRLAVRYGWQRLGAWPGGVWFCDLTVARSATGIVTAVAGALGVPVGRGDPVEQLGHVIASRRRCLVVLDNFEQVSRFAGETLEKWLERAPDARFLVTSRERLNLRGEDVQPVGPLGLEAGAELFAARAGTESRAPDASGTEAEAVREVVRLTEGMPLAIELAAARVRMMTVGELVDRMRERFRLLRAPGTGRQASLEATIDVSWEMLEPWEKAAWAQCAVFEGGFTPEAAERVIDLSPWPEAPWVVDVVQALVDRSLLRTWTLAGPSDANTGARPVETRLGMYVTLQAYARNRLREDDARAGGDPPVAAERAAEERHGRWYARYGSRDAILALRRRGGTMHRRRLERELENLVVACRRAAAREDPATAVATYRALSAVLEIRGPFAPAVELGRELLERLRLRPEDEAVVAKTLGHAESNAGMIESARPRLEAVLAYAREAGDREVEGNVLGALGGMYLSQGRVVDARRCTEAALAAARETGDRHLEGGALGNLGLACRDEGRLEEASAYLEEALAVARSVEDRRLEGSQLTNLGLLQHEGGRTEEARASYEAALAIHREVGNRRFEGNVHTNLGKLHYEQGRLDLARASLETALAVHREVGDRSSEAIALANLGAVHALEGRLGEARARYEDAMSIERDLRNRRLEGYMVGALAKLHHDQGEQEAAGERYEAALEIHRDVGDRRSEGATLTRMSSLHRDRGAPGPAKEMLAEAESILREVDARLELGELLCVRAMLEHESGDRSAARASFEEAAGIAARLGAGPDSDLGRELARARARLAADGGAPPGAP